MTTVAGIPEKPYEVKTASSMSTRHGITKACLVQYSLAALMRSSPFFCSRVLMPNTSTGLPDSFAHLANSETNGRPRLHGPHHSAQKSTTTTRPLRSARLTVLPSRVESENDGAASPTLTAFESPPPAPPPRSSSSEATAVLPSSLNAIGVASASARTGLVDMTTGIMNPGGAPGGARLIFAPERSLVVGSIEKTATDPPSPLRRTLPPLAGLKPTILAPGMMPPASSAATSFGSAMSNAQRGSGRPKPPSSFSSVSTRPPASGNDLNFELSAAMVT